MKDFLKKFIYTGVSLVSETADKFKETVDALIDEGKISKNEGAKVVNDFIENAETKKEELEEQFDKLINKLVKNFSFADKDEISILEKRITELENQAKKKNTSKKPIKKKTVKKTVSKTKKTKAKPPKEGKE